MKYATLAIVALLAIAGCEHKPPAQPVSSRDFSPNTVTINGNTVTGQPGSTITAEIENEQYQGEGIDKQEGSATGTGAGLTTQSEKAVNEFNASAPLANLIGFGSASGGTTDIASTLMGKAGTPLLAWLGGLLFVAGIAAFCLKRVRDGAILCIGGLVAFGASLIGPVGWIVLVVIVVGLAAAYLYASRKGMLSHEALRGITEGIENAPDDVRRVVKAEISNTTDDADKRTIRAVKKADDLPAERA